MTKRRRGFRHHTLAIMGIRCVPRRRFASLFSGPNVIHLNPH